MIILIKPRDRNPFLLAPDKISFSIRKGYLGFTVFEYMNRCVYLCSEWFSEKREEQRNLKHFYPLDAEKEVGCA